MLGRKWGFSCEAQQRENLFECLEIVWPNVFCEPFFCFSLAVFFLRWFLNCVEMNPWKWNEPKREKVLYFFPHKPQHASFFLFCVFKHLSLGCIKSRHSCCVLLQSISKSILWLQCWYWRARKEGGIDSGEYEYLKLDGRRLHSGDRKEQHYCWETKPLKMSSYILPKKINGTTAVIGRLAVFFSVLKLRRELKNHPL